MRNITDRVLTKSIKVASTTTFQYKLGDDSKLRNKRVLAIEAHRVGEVATDHDNLVVVADTVFEKACLTLSVDGEESIDNVPLTVFNRPDNNGQLLYLGENGKLVNLESSFIKIASGATLTADTVFVLTFHYAK